MKNLKKVIDYKFDIGLLEKKQVSLLEDPPVPPPPPPPGPKFP